MYIWRRMPTFLLLKSKLQEFLCMIIVAFIPSYFEGFKKFYKHIFDVLFKLIFSCHIEGTDDLDNID